MGNLKIIQSQIIFYRKQQACISHWKLWVFAELSERPGGLTQVHRKQTFTQWKRSRFPFAVPCSSSQGFWVGVSRAKWPGCRARSHTSALKGSSHGWRLARGTSAGNQPPPPCQKDSLVYFTHRSLQALRTRALHVGLLPITPVHWHHLIKPFTLKHSCDMTYCVRHPGVLLSRDCSGRLWQHLPTPSRTLTEGISEEQKES